MAFTKEIISFAGLSDSDIKSKLLELNIPLTVEEARKIHHGEVEKRNIYGDASSEDAEELREEGIEISQIPWVPRHDS